MYLRAYAVLLSICIEVIEVEVVIGSTCHLFEDLYI